MATREFTGSLDVRFPGVTHERLVNGLAAVVSFDPYLGVKELGRVPDAKSLRTRPPMRKGSP